MCSLMRSIALFLYFYVICCGLVFKYASAAEGPELIRDERNRPLYYKNPLPEQCGAAINESTYRIDSIYQALEGMRVGYKHIYLGFSRSLTPDIEPHIEALGAKYLILERPSDGFGLILYTSDGERNALLLQKYQLQKKVAFERNDYLVGKLLNYEEEDIKYFYKRAHVLQDLMLEMGDRIHLPYMHWSATEQERFDSLVSANERWAFAYENNKKCAVSWLAAHEDYTIAQLEHFNMIRTKKIHKKNNKKTLKDKAVHFFHKQMMSGL